MNRLQPFVVAIIFLIASEVNCAEFFSSDIETGTLSDIFDSVDTYGFAELSTDQAHSGSTSIRIRYTENEAGSNFYKSFPPTTTLFTRKYEYFAPGWEGNWPVGLKTSRYFTGDNYSLSGPLAGQYAYLSEKIIYDWSGPSNNKQYASQYNHAIGNKDLTSDYPSSVTFGNGLPYIRTGHWYKVETWLVLNSAVDVPDGVLQIWIDDRLVVDRQDIAFKSTSRGMPNGIGWKGMWFGGNYTNYGVNPSETLYRYIDDVYLSTTRDITSTETGDPNNPIPSTGTNPQSCSPGTIKPKIKF